MQPSVAVVILNWNGKRFLEQFLPPLLESVYPNLQFVVADNASTDDSVSFVRHRYPSVRLVLLEKNYGFAEGYNRALQQVQADYFILLNSDVEVGPNWIEPVIRLMESDPRIAAAQPTIRSFAEKSLFEYAGAAGGWMDMLGYPFCRGRVFDTCEADQGQYPDVMDIAWASGACLFIRSARYRDLQGFDPGLFAHMEEIDLCWRLLLAGHRVVACPQSVVYHVGGGTLNAGSPRKTFLNYRNNLIIMSRNFPRWQLLWKLPARIMLDGVSALREWFSGRSPHALAILRAHGAWLSGLFGQSDQRYRPMKRGVPGSGYYRGLLIWDYFVQGRKRFSEIIRLKK